MTLGTTSRTAPETPDLAGKPTWGGGRSGSEDACAQPRSRDGRTHVEGELAGEVVHAAGMHEAQGVPHGFGAQHALARDWTDAPVGQRGGHDTA